MRLLFSRRGSAEPVAAIGILVLLVVIAAAVIVQGLCFAPVNGRKPGNGTAASASPAPVQSFIAPPAGFKAASPAESYTPQTLYEKIDGKAELYLEAGFVAMKCQRFASLADPGAWLEVFAYDMGDAVNAFSVYGQQRRSDVKPLDVTPFAYKTVDGVYFSAGGTYVEIHGSAQTPELDAAMLAVAKSVAGTVKIDPGIAAAIATFPKEGQEPGSAALYPTDAFGCSFLDNVYTMQYKIDGKLIMAFASPRPSAEAAAKLAADYSKFIADNGGGDISLSMAWFPAKVFKLYGTTEVVFAKGSIVAGVHGADDGAVAVNLAKKLWDKLPDTATPTASPAPKASGDTYEEQQ